MPVGTFRGGGGLLGAYGRRSVVVRGGNFAVGGLEARAGDCLRLQFWFLSSVVFGMLGCVSFDHLRAVWGSAGYGAGSVTLLAERSPENQLQ